MTKHLFLLLSYRTVVTSSLKFMERLEDIRLENLAIKALPVDTSKRTGRREVAGACFSLVDITPVENPKLVAKSDSALQLLDIDGNKTDNKTFVEYFSGNKLLPGSEPASHCYSGHQFGYFSGQLGDGTVAYLGDLKNSLGERWEMQLKGIGHTPYSRAGDGRKVLRSSVREFLCSEAMHYLGIPTTRAGVVIDSETKVTRDMFYDGHPRRENCALVLRIAPTFLRFGSFEIFKHMDETTGKSGPSVGQTELLQKLLRYTISTFYPKIIENFSADDHYLQFYKEVCVRTAHLVAQWQAYGFCHGVLNTDNMSILGLTIDYGPFAFLDIYNPDFVCNATDENGRYSFKKQPEICKWNLLKFSEALKDVLPTETTLQILEQTYFPEYTKIYNSIMSRKLGLLNNLHGDELLVKKLLDTMQETFADYTNVFHSLIILDLPSMPNHEESREKLVQIVLKFCLCLDEVKKISKSSIAVEQLEAIKALARGNSGLLALFGGKGTLQREADKLELSEKLQNSTDEEYIAHIKRKWSAWIALYCERLGKCNDEETDATTLNHRRKEILNQANPKYILRNYIAQAAIDEAEKGNYLEVQNVLQRLEKPWNDDEPTYPLFGFQNITYDSVPPLPSVGLQLS